MAERVITKVRPKRNLQSFPELRLQKRVAAYARVSSDSEEQLNSVEAQKDYFEKLIKEKPEWIFAGVYADEGISGTTLNKRVAFNKMIEDAMNGKIDLIVTKSLSRFARNTVDALNVIKLPAEIKVKALCCLWRKEEHESRMTKIAYQINGCKVRANDRDTFAPFTSVIPYVNDYDGIGIGVFDGFSAVDIDHCVVNGELSELALDIIKTMNSYTEFSPSGTGIRIIFKTDRLS